MSQIKCIYYGVFSSVTNQIGIIGYFSSVKNQIGILVYIELYRKSNVYTMGYLALSQIRLELSDILSSVESQIGIMGYFEL